MRANLSIQSEQFAASAARTANGNTQSTPIDCGLMKEGNFFLDVTVVSGTSPTLDVVVQTKDPESGDWFTLTSFTQATGVTAEMKSVAANMGNKLAIAWTIGGSDTPTFTFSVGAILKG